MKKLLLSLFILGVSLLAGGDSQAGWLFENQKIVFARNLNGNWDLWTCNSRGKVLRQLTNTPTDEVNPIWLKSKQQIAFLRHGNIFIWQKGRVQQLTFQGNYRYLTYDQKNNRLVFSVFIEPEKAALGYLELDQKAAKKVVILQKAEKQLIHPAVNPAGEIIYYVRAYLAGITVRQSIYRLNLSSNQVEPLISKKTQLSFRPSLSPDGKSLVYVAKARGRTSLYRYDLATKRAVSILAGLDYCDYPSWSPRGREILVTVFQEGALKLLKYNLKSQKKKFLPISGECKEADW